MQTSNKADHTVGLYINILDSSLTSHTTTESMATDCHHERPINMVENRYNHNELFNYCNSITNHIITCLSLDRISLYKPSKFKMLQNSTKFYGTA